MAVLAAGVACGLGVVIAYVTTGIVLIAASQPLYADLFAAPMQSVYAPAAGEPWLPLQTHLTQAVITVAAVCIIWALARHPVVTLPIHRVEDDDDE